MRPGDLRESSPDPVLVASIFHRDSAIYRYVDLLSGAGVAQGLIGPREGSRLWSRHILNCAVVAPAIPAGARVADLGSGAGLPGLVLALARPDLRMTLIDSLLRRTRFLAEAVDICGVSNVTVLRARAETLAGPGSDQYDVVTARAVAPLATLATWALPLCRTGGELLAFKGRNAAAELVDAAPALRRLRAGRSHIEEYGGDVVATPTTVVRIESDRRGRDDSP